MPYWLGVISGRKGILNLRGKIRMCMENVSSMGDGHESYWGRTFPSFSLYIYTMSPNAKLAERGTTQYTQVTQLPLSVDIRLTTTEFIFSALVELGELSSGFIDWIFVD